VAAVNSGTRRGGTKIVGVEEPCGAGKAPWAEKSEPDQPPRAGTAENQAPGSEHYARDERPRAARAGVLAVGRARPKEALSQGGENRLGNQAEDGL
jgi:hypothetical protein